MYQWNDKKKINSFNSIPNLEFWLLSLKLHLVFGKFDRGSKVITCLCRLRFFIEGKISIDFFDDYGNVRLSFNGERVEKRGEEREK